MSQSITLYQYPGRAGLPSISPPCMKIEMALRYLELPYEVENLTPLLLKRVSATGRTPVIDIDGERVHDSMSILDRIERARPQAVKWPTSGPEQAHDRLWEAFATDSFYWQCFAQRWLVPENRQRLIDLTPSGSFSPRNLFLRYVFIPRLVKRGKAQGIGTLTREAWEAGLIRSLDLLNTALADGPFLDGRPTAGRGDIAVAAHLAQFGWAGLVPFAHRALRERPALDAFLTRTLVACHVDPPDWCVPPEERAT